MDLHGEMTFEDFLDFFETKYDTRMPLSSLEKDYSDEGLRLLNKNIRYKCRLITQNGRQALLKTAQCEVDITPNSYDEDSVNIHIYIGCGSDFTTFVEYGTGASSDIGSGKSYWWTPEYMLPKGAKTAKSYGWTARTLDDGTTIYKIYAQEPKYFIRESIAELEYYIRSEIQSSGYHINTMRSTALVGESLR